MLSPTQEKRIAASLSIFEDFVEKNKSLFELIELDIDIDHWMLNKCKSTISLVYHVEGESRGTIELGIRHLDNIHISLNGNTITRISEFIWEITKCDNFNHSSIFDDYMYSLIRNIGYLKYIGNGTLVKCKHQKYMITVDQMQLPQKKWEFMVIHNDRIFKIESYLELKKYILDSLFN